MKELSIEEKVRRYDEIINEIKNLRDILLENGVINENGVIYDNFNRIFPELKESEDERIRKAIIQFFELQDDNTTYSFIPKKDILAWLEKQGKNESDPRYKCLEDLLTADAIYQMSMNEAMVEEARTKAINALSELEISKLLGLEKQGEQKPTDKVEPKFHKGEWITIRG